MKTKQYKAEVVTKAKFNKLTREQKIVLVAEDVIQRIEAELLIPEPGVYVRFVMDEDEYLVRTYSSILKDRSGQTQLSEVSERDVQKIVNKAKCEVCGKGAVFLSYIGLFDSIDGLGFNKQASWLGYGGRDQSDVRELFGPNLFDWIERIFELWSAESGSLPATWRDWWSNNMYERIVPGGDKKRLIWIMKNLIKSKGLSPFPKEAGLP